jgi:uncharacterized protein YehS (DUF1456 family)
MITNDVLRSVRYMLDLGDAHVVDILQLGDYQASREDVAGWLKKEGEDGFVECPPPVLAHFLNGLVILKRGKNDKAGGESSTDAPVPVDSPPSNLAINNNMILKKLRIAFELKEEDLNQIMDAAGFRISKPELSALFRKEGHKNYRPCGDQFLRNFLKGLTLRIRG